MPTVPEDRCASDENDEEDHVRRMEEERSASEDRSVNEVGGRGDSEAREDTESEDRVASGRCADKAKHKTPEVS